MIDLIHSILYTHYLSRIWCLIVTSSWLLLCLFHTWACWNNLLTRISGFLGTFPVSGFQFLHWKSCLRKFPSPGVNQDSFSPCFYLGCFSHGLPTVYSWWIQGDPFERQSLSCDVSAQNPSVALILLRKAVAFSGLLLAGSTGFCEQRWESWFWVGWCWGTHEMLN